MHTPSIVVVVLPLHSHKLYFEFDQWGSRLPAHAPPPECLRLWAMRGCRLPARNPPPVCLMRVAMWVRGLPTRTTPPKCSLKVPCKEELRQ